MDFSRQICLRFFLGNEIVCLTFPRNMLSDWRKYFSKEFKGPGKKYIGEKSENVGKIYGLFKAKLPMIFGDRGKTCSQNGGNTFQRRLRAKEIFLA